MIHHVIIEDSIQDMHSIMTLVSLVRIEKEWL
jgi:hypothetical protein